MEDYNPTKKIRVLIVFDDMITDNKKNLRSDIDFKDFMKRYKEYTKEPY